MDQLTKILKDVANAIRRKKSTTISIKPKNLAKEILSIPQTTTGIFQTKEIDITSNGVTTVTPDEGFDGMSSATITTNVQTPLQTKNTTLTSSGATTITPDTGYDGMSSVVVTPNLQAKTANCTSTSAVTLKPDSGYAGLSSAKVTPVTETRTHNVTANGSSSISVNSGKVGMTKVTVNTSVYRTLANTTTYVNSNAGLSQSFTIPTGVTTAKIIVSLRYPSVYNFYPSCTTNSGTISTSVDNRPGISNNMYNRITVYTLTKSASASATVTVKSNDGSGAGSSQIHYYSAVAIY